MLPPQAVCDIADMCTSHGTSLAECAPESAFGQALLQAGESFGQCRDLQYALDDETNQQFIGPVKEIIERDAKEINVRVLFCDSCVMAMIYSTLSPFGTPWLFCVALRLFASPPSPCSHTRTRPRARAHARARDLSHALSLSHTLPFDIYCIPFLLYALHRVHVNISSLSHPTPRGSTTARRRARADWTTTTRRTRMKT